MCVVLIDLGVGNVKSVENWLNKIGISFAVLNNDSETHKYIDSILVFPGVADSVEYVNAIKCWPELTALLKNNLYKRVIAICAGFQMLCEEVTENGRTVQGLGFIPATSKDIDTIAFHNGWELVVFSGMNMNERYYFNHGCGVFPNDNSNHSFGLSMEGFANIYVSEKITAFQFHPEKSGEAGVELGKSLFDV